MYDSLQYKIPTVLYIDPPWRYNSRSMNRITKFGGGAMSHYPVMTDSQLVDFGETVDTTCGGQCIMFMWVTGARLDFGLELLKEWGFKYGTVAFVWNKLNPKAGTPVTTPGFYTSSSCEFVLVGTKGKGHKPAVFPIPQYQAATRREHSRKPDCVRKEIETMYPCYRWIEFFARETSPGWEAYGNEVEKFD